MNQFEWKQQHFKVNLPATKELKTVDTVPCPILSCEVGQAEEKSVSLMAEPPVSPNYPKFAAASHFQQEQSQWRICTPAGPDKKAQF